jgi:hypothetical protein
MRIQWWSQPCRMAEDEGAGGGGGDGEDKGTGGGGLLDLVTDEEKDAGTDDEGGEKEKDEEKAATTVEVLKFDEKPDWLPKPFFDEKTGQVNVEALAKSQTDLRQQASKSGKAPAKPADYDLAIADDNAELKAIEERVVVPDEETGVDPLVEGFRTAAHELNLSPEQAKGLYEWYLKTGGELLPDPVDQEAEVKKLGENGMALLRDLKEFQTNLLAAGALNDDTAAAFGDLCTTAEGALLIQQIREHYMDRRIPDIAAHEAASSEDAASLKAEMAVVMEAANDGDPTANRKYELLMQKYTKLYGTAPAGSSIVTSS